MIAHFLLVATFLTGIGIGFGFGKLHTSLDYIHCDSYTKNGVMWVGYVSMRDNEIRCFWKEERYPWRVVQGVPTR